MNSPVCKSTEGEFIDAPWGKLTWLASRKLGNSTTMTFGRVIIPANQTNPRHRHPNCDEILHLLSGRIEHSLADKKFTLEPHDTISIPAGQWHNARALDGVDAEMVICFSSADRETEFEGSPLTVDS
jgi:quercetin dioxygenase-like cupin family protein